MTDNAPGQGPQTAAAQAEVGLQRIYVKDLSFEAPHSPQVFTESWQPQLNVSLNSQVMPLGSDHFEVVIVVAVTAKSGEKTAYHAEVQQAGVFLARNVPEADRGPLFGIFCPNVLFPYARESISDLVGRGGFPPFLLQPVNFEAIYVQRLAQRRPETAPDSTAAESDPTQH
jgi:preprotein translocase subunit SecB